MINGWILIESLNIKPSLAPVPEGSQPSGPKPVPPERAVTKTSRPIGLTNKGTIGRSDHFPKTSGEKY